MARFRSDFSIPHLIAAATFSRQVSAIEKEHEAEPFGPFWDDIRAFSTACVFTAVAALESYINEVFADCDKHFTTSHDSLVRKLWSVAERQPVLDKFEFGLLLRNGSSFKKGAKPYQDIDVLVKLRNALIHFNPEWEDEQKVHASLSKQLRYRFDPSAFMTNHDPLFPKGWACSGCTKWSVRSAVKFIYKFEERAGLDHRLDNFKNRLKV